VFGREELGRLAQQRKTLVAESDLNRLVLQSEIQNLRKALGWVGEAGRWPRKLGPLMLVLAPLAGFLMARGTRRPDSWLNRLTAAAKWMGSLYTLWKAFSGSRADAGSEKPAG
jgi:hypothetical protein